MPPVGRVWKLCFTWWKLCFTGWHGLLGSFGNLQWWAKTLQERIQILIGRERASRLSGHPLISTLAKEKKSLHRCQFSGPGAVPNEALAAKAVVSIVIPPEHEPIERSLGLAL